MKKALILKFLIILLYANLFAQKDKYPSKEEDEYYKNLGENFVPFKPLNKAFVLEFKPEYYEIHESISNYKPYTPDKFTPYLDSILSKMPWHEYVMQIFESKIKIEKIGDIEKEQILKYEKKDSIEAFIYASYEYEERYYGGGPGIWIAYSVNNGKDWKYYYTGIVQGQPVHIKYYSQRPLIKEKDKLEIEACLLRQISSFGHPVGADFECVKDGIYLVFDINIMAKDSDGDGLTDIVEDKLYLDKYNKDTDGDGIPDNLDMNPRVYYPRTEKSKIYEAILDDAIDWNDETGIGRLLFHESTPYNVTDFTETILIITDNEDLMGIQPQKYRVIFMTTDEYQNKSKPYNMNPRSMRFSPLFKVDNMRDTYKIHHSFGTAVVDYLIRKTKNGWTIEMLSMWIS